jgi:hypothetical protein
MISLDVGVDLPADYGTLVVKPSRGTHLNLRSFDVADLRVQDVVYMHRTASLRRLECTFDGSLCLANSGIALRNNETQMIAVPFHVFIEALQGYKLLVSIEAAPEALPADYCKEVSRNVQGTKGAVHLQNATQSDCAKVAMKFQLMSSSRSDLFSPSPFNALTRIGPAAITFDTGSCKRGIISWTSRTSGTLGEIGSAAVDSIVALP